MTVVLDPKKKFLGIFHQMGKIRQKRNFSEKNKKTDRAHVIIQTFKQKTMSDALLHTVSSDEDEVMDTSSVEHYIPSPIHSPTRPSLVAFEVEVEKQYTPPKAPRPSFKSSPSLHEELGNVDWLLDLPSPMSPQTDFIDKILTFTEDEFDALVANFDIENEPSLGENAYSEVLDEHAVADDIKKCIFGNQTSGEKKRKKKAPSMRVDPPPPVYRTPPQQRTFSSGAGPLLTPQNVRILQELASRITRDVDGKIDETQANQFTVKQLFKSVVDLITHNRHYMTNNQMDGNQLTQACADAVNHVIESYFNVSLEEELRVDGFELYAGNNYVRPLLRTIVAYDKDGNNMFVSKKMRLFKKKGYKHIGDCVLFLHNRKL